jgi:formate hydrogenlyase subunit 4
MNRSTFMAIATVVSVICGLAALLAPAELAAIFGVKVDDVTISEARLLGAAYLGYAAINWFGRDVRDISAQRAIAIGNFASWTLSLVVTLVAIATGLGNVQTWLLVAVEVPFAAAWAYLTFADRSEAAAA